MTNNRSVHWMFAIVVVAAVFATIVGAFLWHRNLSAQIHEATRLASNKEYDKALEQIDSLFASFIPFPDIVQQAHAQRGLVYAEQDQKEWAIQELRAAQSLFEDDQNTLIQLARLELDAGNLDRAEKTARDVLVLNPNQTDARIELALISLKKGEEYKDQTVSLAREAANGESAPMLLKDIVSAIDAHDDARLLDVARDAVKKNNPRFALFALDFVSAQNALSRDALFYRGYAELLEGKPDEAKKFILESLALDEDNSLIHYVLGNTYYVLEEYDAALQEYDRAKALGLKEDGLEAQRERVGELSQ